MIKERLDLYNGIIYKPEGEIKCIIQVIHGISEHMGRYEDLASFLCDHHIALAGFDLRGHGINCNDEHIATFHNEGWYKTIDEIHEFSLSLYHTYHIPIYMLGFSLGSFLLREYISLYNNSYLKGVIIAGTGYQPKMVLNMMISVVQTQINASGFDGTTSLINKLLFENYNSKFHHTKTPFDWLCSDEQEVQHYINDELCIKIISSGLFYQLLCSMKTTGYKAIYELYNKELPILLLSGKDDPVGEFTKSIKHIYKDLKEVKMKDVEMEILQYSRHDIFHEKKSGDAQIVQQLIMNWINKHQEEQ